MKDTDYAFAVARIRANEARLLTQSDFDTLISCKDLPACLDFLATKNRLERGKDEVVISELIRKWGDELWLLLCESVPDKSVLDIFCVQNDFFNLKAALKCSLTGKNPSSLFKTPTSLNLKELLHIVEAHDFDKLGEPYSSVCAEAYETALKTENGQSADVILDRATMELMVKKSRASNDEITKKTLNLLVACANIKIAVRSCRTKKELSFLKASLCECDGLDVDALAQTAIKSEEELFAYLEKTDYSKGAEYLKSDATAFEKWCDDSITEITKQAKFKFFGFEPIIAYYFAKTTEIKLLRLILCGKEAGLDDAIIKERMRALYV